MHYIQYVSNPKPGHTTGGSGRGGARRGGENWTPTSHVAQETTVPFALQGFKGIVDNAPERFFGSTVTRNPM